MARLIAADKTIDCKLIIFDKDGTLVDQHMVLLELAKARRKNVRKHVGEEAAELWERIVGVDLKNGKVDHSGPLATAPRREEVLIVATGFYLSGISWSEAKELAHRAYDEADDSMTPPYGSVLLEGVVEALRRLDEHGLKLAIASTDTRRRTVTSFKALGIASFFDEIVGGDDVVNGKPSADMIFEICKKTGFKPDEAVMVGDSMSDIQMGKNAKVKACIGVLTGSIPREKLEQIADVVIASVSDLHVL
jgi:HAD superfamily hydrolase (TIGR01549 family)